MIMRHPLPLFCGAVRNWLHCSGIQPTQLLEQEGNPVVKFSTKRQRKEKLSRRKKKLMTTTLKICRVILEKSTFDTSKKCQVTQKKVHVQVRANAPTRPGTGRLVLQRRRQAQRVCINIKYLWFFSHYFDQNRCCTRIMICTSKK